MKHLLTFLVVLLLPCMLLAQDYDETKKKINSIKKSSSYIYADFTGDTQESAYAGAQEQLLAKINEYADSQAKLQNAPNIVVNNKKELWETMTMPRGNVYRAFVYVKKKDILAADNTEVLTKNEEPKQSEVANETKAAQPETPHFPAAATDFLKCQKYSQAGELLKVMLADKRIAGYERYEKMVNANLYYLIIYNREGNVVAVLSPGPDRYNLATGEKDSVTNYKGCGATGFLIE